MTISNKKLDIQTKELSQVITVITPCSDLTRQHLKNYLIRLSVAAVANFVQVVIGKIARSFITVYSFKIKKLYNCNSKNILNHFYF